MIRNAKPTREDQIKRFEESAHALDCDESEDRFNAALGKIARAKPSNTPPEPPKKPKALKTEKPAK